MTLLFLNSLGTGEVIFILFVVLLLFGSKGIPDVVKNLGRGMNEIRNASNEIKRDIQKSALEMRKDLQLDETMKDITKLADQAIDDDMNKKIADTSPKKEDTNTDTNDQPTEKSA